MSISGDFVNALERYFGPWRGNGKDKGVRVKQQIAHWLDEQNIPELVLKEIFRELTETHKIQPVNTISIADLDAALDRYCETPRPSDALQLEGPERFTEPECDESELERRKDIARRLHDLVETCLDNTKRAELLRSGEANVKTAQVEEEVSF